MSVVVTGGAGFIGSNLVKSLCSEGYEVVVLDNFSYGGRRVEGSKIRVVKGDIRDEGVVTTALRDVDYVIHLAAIVGVTEAREDPLGAFDVNVKGTLRLLEASRRLGVEKFVYASSVAVYGEPLYLPIDEAHPLNPKNVYGATKLAGEALVSAYGEEYGIPTVALRYFNVYGPNMRSGPYAGVISRFMESGLRGEPLTIFGDGSQTRDFVYVEDVVRATLRALGEGIRGVYNVGTGRSVTILELAELVMKVVGRKLKVIYGPPRPGDIKHSRADISKAIRELGWRPEIPLEEGLRLTLEHFKSSLKA